MDYHDFVNTVNTIYAKMIYGEPHNNLDENKIRFLRIIACVNIAF